jgi:glycogen operon protein
VIGPGVRLAGDGVDVAVFSAHATAIEFCLFEGDRERRFRLTERIGDLWYGHVPGVGAGALYGLRAHGPFAPREGHRFNPSKLLLDPYAVAIDRAFRLHTSMFGDNDDDSAPFMPKGIVTVPALAQPATEITPWSRSVVYELHVRGFTMRHPGIPEALRGTFAGLAHPAAIAHLVRLGVTAVEVLPPSAWIEERHLAARGLTNYWGYNTTGFLAPDPRLAPGGWAEVRDCVAALAAAGIETIVDVVFNHSGEGDALGPTLCLRGLDNAAYYHLPEDAPERYVDDSGCGNTLALDRAPSLNLAMESLRAWARFAGVHGFRFDLAATMGRTRGGFDVHAPLLCAIGQDPVLRSLKLIAEPWDIGPGGYNLGKFPDGWGEWNDRFRDDVRRFWRGDGGALGGFATRLAGSEDMFARQRRPSRSVNYVVAHDGFTLADLVSYAQKHNWANAEDNRDGSNDNASWNNGVEGPSADGAILAARAQDQRALLASLLLARGTPMLCMGSELGQSQGGNNNAYAQDSETAWLDWASADAALLDWTARLVALRTAHAALRQDAFLTGQPVDAGLMPDVQWRRPDGEEMGAFDWSGDVLAMVLTTAEDRVCLGFNRGPGSHDLVLPAPRDGKMWRMEADSARPEAAAERHDHATIILHGRAVLVLAEIAAPAPRAAGVGTEALDQLARAAGIAPFWWEVDGTHHVVSPETKRALLAAMRLPAEGETQARGQLAFLADTRDRRPLPQAVVARDETRAVLDMALEPGLARRPVWLNIALEDGGVIRHRVGAEDGDIVPAMAVDGRPLRHWRVSLPQLPIGRHHLMREDMPELHCGVAIAPRACFVPAGLSGGQRRFGVTAQLYALRSQGDQGIGDFSTLRALADATAARGGAALGLNPLHALFSAQRERASPYNPSDRRFLDPIYLDITRMEDGTDPAVTADTLAVAARLRTLSSVAYSEVWALKSAVLAQRFAAFADLERRWPMAAAVRDFAGFLVQGGTALRGFALFEVISELRQGQPWPLWPAALQHAASPEVAAIADSHGDRLRYHQYLQWQCDRQLGRAASGLEIGLIRDLAVGSAPDGGEAWSNEDLLTRGVSIGAPPDPFSASGQVWSLPPPDPNRMAAHGYAGFAELLDTNLRHAGGLRIDHVMALARLFWVPDGMRGRDGAYVGYPTQDLLGHVALASARARALVVGEDLGTVPDGLREALTAHDILSYRVLLLEREGLGFRSAAAYPSRAMACVSTHDLPTLAGWWEGADIAERTALGQFTPADTRQADQHRAIERAELSATLHQPAPGPGPVSPDFVAAAHGFVAETSCDLAMAQTDDLDLERNAVNLPGTDTERPNWRRRLRTPVPDLFETPAASAILGRLRVGRS